MHTLELRAVTVRRGSRTVISHTDWCVPPGITALLGQNGAGKTTLMRASVGLLPTTSGQRYVLGEEVLGELPSSIRNQVSWLPQSPHFPRGVSVEAATRHSAWLRGVPRTERTDRVEQALELVNLAGHKRVHISRLSGGEQRRVALATAMVGSPRLLLLDEPTVGLDPDQRESLLTVLRHSVHSGLVEAIVLSTHIFEDVVGAAQHVDLLRDGRISGRLTLEPTTSDLSSRYSAMIAVRDFYSSGLA